jgi:hypothetical protein
LGRRIQSPSINPSFIVLSLYVIRGGGESHRLTEISGDGATALLRRS